MKKIISQGASMRQYVVKARETFAPITMSERAKTFASVLPTGQRRQSPKPVPRKNRLARTTAAPFPQTSKHLFRLSPAHCGNWSLWKPNDMPLYSVQQTGINFSIVQNTLPSFVLRSPSTSLTRVLLLVPLLIARAKRRLEATSREQSSPLSPPPRQWLSTSLQNFN